MSAGGDSGAGAARGRELGSQHAGRGLAGRGRGDPRVPAFVPCGRPLALAAGGCTSHLLPAFYFFITDPGGGVGDWRWPPVSGISQRPLHPPARRVAEMG